jgi:tRNA A37 methylthiotransferase MiaB
MGERKRVAFGRTFIGRTLGVLVEHTPARGSGGLTGYSRNYQRVEFQGALALANQEVEVRIVASRGATLVGQTIDGPPP